MHSLIDEAKSIPSIQRIGFTGGECFLLGRALDALIAHAHELEFETRVVTNGYWAGNALAAERRISSLCVAGLDQIMISTGTFHQEFVPIERVIHAARAAATARIPCRIAIEVCDQQTFDESILHKQLAPEIAARQVFLGHDPWTTDVGGRGVTPLTHRQLIDGGNALESGRCTQIMDTITVTPNQDLLACCGFPMEQLPELRIGSIANRTLAEVLREAPNGLMKLWLHVGGPHAIADFIAQTIPDFAIPQSVSICQACATLQRDPRAMAVIAERGSEVGNQIVSAFVELHSGIAALRAF